MSIEEKAHEYALKAMEEQISKVSQAYIDGYNDAKAEFSHEPVIDENGIKWYDMDLPSGNLWSEPLRDKEGSLLYIVYNQAKELDIPTFEDVKELKNCTQRYTLSGGITVFNSINGMRYEILHSCTYWLKGEKDRMYAKAFGGIDFPCSDSFKGNKNCIVLIKRKAQ